MRDLATSLREQAAELRTIGHAEGLEGRYAEKLRSDAMDLERHLRQTAERYEHVQGHLVGWADELEDFQSESARLLQRARAARDDARAGSARDAAGATEGTARGHAADDEAIRAYRQSLTRLTGRRDERAVHYAGRIRDACDDVIKDSRWERFEDGIGDFLDGGWLTRLLTVASWVVTVVGLICLFCTPVDWVIDLIAVVGIALAGKDLLAAFTGNGTWADVALDAVGLLGGYTLGKALKSLTAIRAATKIAAEGAAAEHAAARVVDDSRSVLDRSYAGAGRRTGSRAAKAEARAARRGVLARAERAADEARAAERARPEPVARKAEARGYGGDTELAGKAKDIIRMRVAYPTSAAVQEASKRAGLASGIARAAWAIPAGSDLVDKLAGFDSAYGRAKDRFTLAVGSRW